MGLFLVALPAAAQKQLLYVTHSAGYRHDSIARSIPAMEQAGRRAGIEVTVTEDLAVLNAESLARYDAVFFFTSGELALTEVQKRDLLEFVRSGKGFGGAHSATDTLYTWPEYGDLIGGYFDGHPWTQEAAVRVEDSGFPGMAGEPSFRLTEEYYQFRAFSRERVRVLLSLDPDTVDLSAPGVNRTDRDFALAWTREYGEGRVYYTALGHFDATWEDPRFQQMLEGALGWLTGQVEATANLVEVSTTFAPGSIVAIYGRGLGEPVEVNGQRATVLYASLPQVNVQLPFDLSEGEASLRVAQGKPFPIRIVAAAPSLAAGVRDGASLWLYATGLGNLPEPPVVEAEGREAPVTYSGFAPGLPGVYLVTAELPEATADVRVRLRVGEAESNEISVP